MENNINIAKINGMKFHCDNVIELWRIKTLFTKEPGTIAWIDSFTEDDVFYDVGANIGLYSVYAAQKVKKIYAFEPHIINAARLMQNAVVNNLQLKVSIITAPLTKFYFQKEFADFFYYSLKAGSSNSQLNSPIGEGNVPFSCTVSEIKYPICIDDLLDRSIQPTKIKIDVDGQELDILNGAKFTLKKVKEIQVEIHNESKKEIERYLKSLKFSLKTIHYTSSGEKIKNEGGDISKVPYNAIYGK